MENKDIDKDIKYVLVTGQIKDTKGKTVSLVSNIVTNILFNAMRSGSNVRKIALILTEFLDSLNLLIKDIIGKSIYYTALSIFALLLYIYSISYLASVVNNISEPGINGIGFMSTSFLPLVGAAKNMILESIVYSFMAAEIAVAKMLRGSFATVHETSFIPVILLLFKILLGFS